MDRRDVWLPSDRWREKPWGHVTICLPSYISLPTQMDGEIWRYTGKQKSICSSCRVSFQTIKTLLFFFFIILPPHNDVYNLKSQLMWVLWPHSRYWWKLLLDQVAKTFLGNSEYLELFGNVWHVHPCQHHYHENQMWLFSLKLKMTELNPHNIHFHHTLICSSL